MFITVINSLTPVFLMMAMGWLLRYKNFLSPTALQGMARLTYWIGVPSFLFNKIAATDPALGRAADILLALVGATLLGSVLAYGLARGLRIPRTGIGTFLQAVFRGNLAFVGLPVIIYAFTGLAQGDAVVQAALVIFGPMVVLYNISAVLVLLVSRAKINAQAFGKLSIELLTNPLLLACLAGGLYALQGWPVPLALERSLNAVGQSALPLALICMGGTLVTVRLRGNLLWIVCAALGKVLMMPLLGLLMATLLQLSAEGTRVVLILLACPTAAVSFVVVRQLGGDEALASGSILLSTLLSAVSLAAILALTQ
ncbi:MAG: AEC family transporter [Candidatus Competibacteraceae bacterium]|nr:AEC family transporter [Candidatus Competibacteraceae bacterium]